jgi:hypothetical protein
MAFFGMAFFGMDFAGVFIFEAGISMHGDFDGWRFLMGGF